MLLPALRKRIADLFKVRAGEERTASLVLAMTSLVTVGGTVGGNAIEALFFSRQGTAALPALYMALGITNFVVSLAITAVLGRVARVRVYLALPLVLATSLALQRVVLVLDIPWTYAVFWLLMNVEGLLQGMLAWGVALRTHWDTDADAVAFEAAATPIVERLPAPAALLPGAGGPERWVLIGSDATVLQRLGSVLGLVG